MSTLQNVPLRDLLILSSLKGMAGKNNLFVERPQIDQSQFDESWLEKKLKEGVNTSLPLNNDQIKEAIKLIKTGKLGEDLKFSLNEGLTTFANVPAKLLKNPFSLFTSPLHTLALTETTARKAAKIFVDPNNRTFRLGILAYARMNGINITESNINEVYNLLDDHSSDNLEELAKGGLETIKDTYGLNDLSEALKKFKSLTHQLS